MNYVYTIFDSNFVGLASIMLKTVSKHCKCKFIIYGYNISKDQHKHLEAQTNQKLNIIPLTKEEWLPARILCKIDKLSKTKFNIDDKVFVLDVDLILQDDIFSIFDTHTEDVLYTTRNPHLKNMPINSGAWGFRYNQNVKEFLTFFTSQIIQPTWSPYLKYFNNPKFSTLRQSKDMLSDQDMLCAVYDQNGILPENMKCTFIDIGYKYNYCLDDVSKVLKNFGNKDYKILHFKGHDKTPMLNLSI